jgi:cytidylate kinase
MPLITVTASIGCGARSVARALAGMLGLELYDDDRLQHEAVSMGYSSEDLKAFDIKAPGLFDRLLRRRTDMYDELMAAVIYEVARRGEGIIMGHGAFYFLKDFSCALHLRLHASTSFRVQRLVDLNLAHREAARSVMEKRDHEIKGFLDFLFQIDWNDLSLYDLVINVDKLGIDAAAEAVAQVVQADPIRECSLGAVDSMAKLSLMRRVAVAVMKDNINIHELGIEVPEPGVVRLTGLINPPRSTTGMIELVQSVSGVKKVICEAKKYPSIKM